MDTRKRILTTFLIVAVGFLAGILLRPHLPTSDADAELQLRQDVEALLKAVQPRADGLYQLGEDFRASWEPRRREYSRDQLLDMRSRLHVFIDHVVVEHADASVVYTDGARDAISAEARATRLDLRDALGDELADLIIRDSEALREDAFTASPETAGYDPGLPDYAALALAIRDVAVLARTRADELTAPPTESE